MNFQIVLILVLAIQASTVFGQDIESLNLSKDEIKQLSPVHCKKSKSPLFKNDTTVKLDIMTDLSKYMNLNNEYKGIYSAKAVVAIQDDENEQDFLPVIFQTRGNSRLALCEYLSLIHI